MSSVGGSPGRCFLKTSMSASSSRVAGSLSSVFWMKDGPAEELEDLLVRRRVDLELGEPVRREEVTEQLLEALARRKRTQERRDGELALAVDPA